MYENLSVWNPYFFNLVFFCWKHKSDPVSQGADVPKRQKTIAKLTQKCRWKSCSTTFLHLFPPEGFPKNVPHRNETVRVQKKEKKNPRRNGWWGCSLHNPISDLPLKPLFQNEAKREAIDLKLIFYSHGNETHLPNKVFALMISWFIASIWKWEFLELGNGLLNSFSDIAIWKACSFKIKGICRTSNSLTNAVF